jgi:hypothetical protein
MILSADVHSTSQHYVEISQLNVLAALAPQKESPVPVRRLTATLSHSGDIPVHSTDNNPTSGTSINDK